MEDDEYYDSLQEFEIYCAHQNQSFYTSAQSLEEAQHKVDANYAPSCPGPHEIRPVRR